MADQNPVSIKKILVPTDFSEISLHALDYAGWIAKQEDAEILLLHVFESYMQNTMLEMRIDFTEIIEKGIEAKMKEIKDNNLHLEGVRLHSKVVVGKIHSEIDRVAAEENVKLIVMGTHGVSGNTNIGKYFIGANAYRTIQNAPCPVITMKDKPWRREVKNIVLPLDSTKESTRKVEIAIRWAKFFKATIHLVAVTAFWEELVVDVKDVAAKVREVEKQVLDAGVKYEAHIIRHKSPSDSVIQYADKVNADLICVVTGQLSILSEMLLGSAARNIISDASIPVLSLNVRQYSEVE